MKADAWLPVVAGIDTLTDTGQELELNTVVNLQLDAADEP